MNATVTDEEFIALWNKYQSPAKLALVIGVNVRAIYLRRRNLEVKHGLQLSVKEGLPAVVERHSHKINYDIDNGTVIVFSDAHFWDDSPTTAYRALIKFIQELNPKIVIANGDIFDGATNSRHASIGWEKKPSLIQELNACKTMMDGSRQCRNRCSVYCRFQAIQFLKAQSPHVHSMVVEAPVQGAQGYC